MGTFLSKFSIPLCLAGRSEVGLKWALAFTNMSIHWSHSPVPSHPPGIVRFGVLSRVDCLCDRRPLGTWFESGTGKPISDSLSMTIIPSIKFALSIRTTYYPCLTSRSVISTLPRFDDPRSWQTCTSPPTRPQYVGTVSSSCLRNRLVL